METYYVVVAKRVRDVSGDGGKTSIWEKLYSGYDENQAKWFFDSTSIADDTILKCMVYWSFQYGIKVKYFCKLENDISFSNLWLGKDGVTYICNAIIDDACFKQLVSNTVS